jgi:hypothetical protein
LDFSILVYSLGALIGPGDGDLVGCTCFSHHSKLAHCSGLGLKGESLFLTIDMKFDFFGSNINVCICSA